MSEDTPRYSSPAAGEVRQGLMPSFVPGAQPPCHHCGCAVHSLTIHDAPALECTTYLRAEIGTLQGEVLALRLQLAARPDPCITTYQQLALATGIPVERLVRLRVFAPEADGEVPVVQGHTVALEFRTQDLPRCRPSTFPDMVDMPEPQTAADAAIADAATWPDPVRTPEPEARWGPAEVTHLGPAQPRVVDEEGA